LPWRHLHTVSAANDDLQNVLFMFQVLIARLSGDVSQTVNAAGNGAICPAAAASRTGGMQDVI